MSPAHPAAHPIRRTNIHLYESDINFLREHFGHGWQTHIRQQVHDWTQRLMAIPKTLGDISDD